MASIAPARMRSTTTALSTRSPRNLGKTMPRLTAPTWWPARPMRCRPDATELGASTWMTRSTAPMSMPSSSELVATTAGRRPALRSSSISVRCSRLTEPWWARASSVSASSLRLAQSRSARRRELANTIVERWARISSTSRSSMWGQIDAVVGCADDASKLDRSSNCRHVLDRHHHRQVERLLARRGHDRDRAGAAEEAGHLVQGPDGGRQADAAGRPLQQLVQALQAEGEVGPALGRDHRVDLVDDHRVDVARASRALEVSSRNSDSGVVMRMSGGWAGKRRRTSAGVSPVRMPTVMSGSGWSRRAAAARRPARGPGGCARCRRPGP